MSVWRPNPIPTQLNVGIAALIATAATTFVPQAYPAQLMVVAGTRASTPPYQQRGINPALIPASAPQIDPSLLGGTAHATRAAHAFSKPSLIPYQPAPLEPDLLDWFEADGAVGQSGVQEAVWAAYRAPANPTQLRPLNPALMPQAGASAPPLPIPYPYAALWRAPAFLPQPAASYNPAIDGPYQVPPLVPVQSLARSAQAAPTQAGGFNAALFPGVQTQPAAQPYPYAALAKPQDRVPQFAPFNPALFSGPQVDAPPLASVASQPQPPFKEWIRPAQNAPFNAAFLPPQVDAPPPSIPYPYSGIARFTPHPTQAVIFCPALVPAPIPPPVVTGFTDVNDSGRKRKPYRSIYAIQEKAEQEYRVLLKATPKLAEKVAEEIAEVVSLPEVAKVEAPKVDTSLIPPPPKFPPIETAEIVSVLPAVEEKPTEPQTEQAPAQEAAPIVIVEAPTVQPHDEADDLEAIQAILHSLGLA